MSTTQVLGDAAFASPGHPHSSLTARIDALPASVGLWSFITLLALGGFFELYDLFRPAISAPGCWQRIFSIPASRVSSVSPTRPPSRRPPLWGCLLAPACLRRWRINWGRRLTFMFALAWYGVFSLMMALQSSAEGVIFCRFLVGVGLGIELVTIDTYLSEWVPTHLRNKAFAFAFFIQFLSVPAVALMSWLLVADYPFRPDRLALGDHLRRALFADYLGYPQEAAGVGALAG
ncbi:transporter [Klebsiella michiganensis]|nr:transporter [Klebsiella michiganensis]